MSHIGILTTIISHIIAGVCLQKQKIWQADVEFGIAEPFDAADANMYAHKQNKMLNPALQQ